MNYENYQNKIVNDNLRLMNAGIIEHPQHKSINALSHGDMDMRQAQAISDHLLSKRDWEYAQDLEQRTVPAEETGMNDLLPSW